MSWNDSNLARFLVVACLVLGIGAGAVSATANLSIEKELVPGTFHAGDEVTWKIILNNTGPDDAFNITVVDELMPEGTFVSASSSDFNLTTGMWNIPALENNTQKVLNLTTRFDENGTYCNRVNITRINDTASTGEVDEDLTDNNDSVCVDIGRTVTLKLVIKPETLNLKSKGVFTVFIDVEGIGSGSGIDLGNTTLTCGNATLIRMMIAGHDEDEGDGDDDADGHRIIAKFQRRTLEIAPGAPVQINCTGYVRVGDETIKVEGNDTIRVIKEKGLAIPFLEKLLRFFGLPTGGEDAGTGEDAAAETPAIPDTIRNLGQAKKYLKENQDEVSVEAPGEQVAGDGNAVTPPGKGKSGEKGGGPEICHGNKCEENPATALADEERGNGKGRTKD